jgi:hypothetical protein
MPSQQPPEQPPIPLIGTEDPASTSGLAPTEEDLEATGTDPTAGQAGAMNGGGATVIPLPMNQIMDRQRPPESDEQRADMPKAGRLTRLASRAEIDAMDMETPDDEVGGRLIDGPSHIGMRRQANLDKSLPLDEQLGRS